MTSRARVSLRPLPTVQADEGAADAVAGTALEPAAGFGAADRGDRGMTRLGSLRLVRPFAALEFVHPMLQRLDLLHQVFDSGLRRDVRLLREGWFSNNGCAQDTDE